MMHNLSTLGISLRSMTNLIDSSETTRLLESRNFNRVKSGE